MLQPAMHTNSISIVESGPTGFIQQNIPYAFAFALGNAPVLDPRIPLGKIVTIAVADGTRAPHAPHDLFARRVPVIPAVTGPVHVAGVRRGDILEIELIALEANGTESIGPLLVTIAVENRSSEPRANSVQSAISAGGVVRLPAQQPGGLLQFGPAVLTQGRQADARGEPVAARMRVRCTVIRPQDN
jgi:acetamidase/formamidase